MLQERPTAAVGGERGGAIVMVVIVLHMCGGESQGNFNLGYRTVQLWL